MPIQWNDAWSRNIPREGIERAINPQTINFAEEFGKYLAEEKSFFNNSNKKVFVNPLTTTQLRKFFGDVKRQQLRGYEESSFLLLKPKLAYAVGRANEKDKYSYNKITDFAKVISKAIDLVVSQPKDNRQKAFENFIAIFEAIVAYHKSVSIEK